MRLPEVVLTSPLAAWLFLNSSLETCIVGNKQAKAVNSYLNLLESFPLALGNVPPIIGQPRQLSPLASRRVTRSPAGDDTHLPSAMKLGKGEAHTTKEEAFTSDHGGRRDKAANWG